MSSAHRFRRAGIALSAACLAALSLSRLVPHSEAGPTPYVHPPMLFGTAAPSKANLVAQEQTAGRQLVAVREYRLWGQRLIGPDQLWMRDTFHTLFLSIRARRSDGSIVPYAAIAAATPGSPLYQDMVSMAAQLNAYGTRVFLTFDHEPETTSANGTPAQFAAAFRTFVTVMRSQGVSAVYMAIFTGWGFSRPPGHDVDAYYPGDAYVDDVGVDVYNWAGCRSLPWTSLAQEIESARVWGLSHPSKHLILTEWGSDEDPAAPGRKASWITDSATLLTQQAYAQLAGVIAWGAGRPATSCPFSYTTSPSATAAWRAMGEQNAYSAG
jgi:hypothetical protein